MSKRQRRRVAGPAAETAAIADEAMVVFRVNSWYRRGTPVYGAPLRCPDCGAFCLVLKVDQREGFCRNRCTECGNVFVVTERAFDAVMNGEIDRPEGVVLPGEVGIEPEPLQLPKESVFGARREAEDRPKRRIRAVSWSPPIGGSAMAAPEVPEDETESATSGDPLLEVSTVEVRRPDVEMVVPTADPLDAVIATEPRDVEPDGRKGDAPPPARKAALPGRGSGKGRSSLFGSRSHGAPTTPATNGEPVLQTVAVAGRVIDPSGGEAPEAPAGEPAPVEARPSSAAPTFGAVLVTRMNGADARLVDPGSPGGGGARPADSNVITAPTPHGERLRVLMVEDNPADAAMAQALLERAGQDAIELRIVTSRQAGIDVATAFSPHVVLLDLDLPDSHGLATITRWCFSDLPGAVVVMSGDYSDAIEQQGREQGVAEFLSKRVLTEWLDQGEVGVAAAMELLGSVAVSS